jgi:4-amino-4-deoxy-L-arabinose transferase-like glycosyltransferase
MTRSLFVACILTIVAGGATLRTLWLRSDPPTRATVGVVWHDEGAWVHNARNRALWGAWRTDSWNPVFLAPVFTGLEYAAFHAFGVGTWQARSVPVASGMVALGFVIAGLTATAGRRAALIGGALLATNYVFVMWNRGALMESTMTSLIVISWAAYALAEERPRWGLVAGIAAVLAFFTKASAAFFVAAIVVDSVTAMLRPSAPPSATSIRSAFWTIVGLATAAAIVGVTFVLPHWSEYRFYNWQMSVVRKPEYTVRALLDRASWLPVIHDVFMWIWPVLVAAVIGIIGIVSSWRTAKPAERLLVLWVLVGLLELIVHDSGNERRYVMFMPALIGLAAIFLGRTGSRLANGPVVSASGRWLAFPVVLGLGYLVAGSLLRVAFLDEIHAGHLHRVVLVSAGVAAIAGIAVLARWGAIVDWLSRGRVPPLVAAVPIVMTLSGDLGHFAAWARDRTDRNYLASIDVGRLLPAGTLVHGKLANGLSLENRIRPIFIGHGFGNYEDRLQRDEVRYILTYVSPSVGYESQEGSGMIQEILDHYPHWRVVATLAVNETGGPDRAELIEKVPGSLPRARD